MAIFRPSKSKRLIFRIFAPKWVPKWPKMSKSRKFPSNVCKIHKMRQLGQIIGFILLGGQSYPSGATLATNKIMIFGILLCCGTTCYDFILSIWWKWNTICTDGPDITRWRIFRPTLLNFQFGWNDGEYPISNWQLSSLMSIWFFERWYLRGLSGWYLGSFRNFRTACQRSEESVVAVVVSWGEIAVGEMRICKARGPIFGSTCIF